MGQRGVPDPPTPLITHMMSMNKTVSQAWVDAFQEKMANLPYFRVTDYMDAVPHLPPRGGFQHPGPEVFYNATKMGSYKTCPTGEDKTCSGQYYLLECLLHTCCHLRSCQ